ncbi:hypothetical protein V496_00028 [Pseudogymnoascus sp. VKM F-4515 (FW-2607)]|nr:hypothetical protein V496_00028 [Pseudogymnoascus sp. VKM F-4515 (FW-2607)]
MEPFSSNNNKIERMPPEILSLIFSYLIGKHIKVARQVCRSFNNNASLYLTDTAIAGSETKSLERFENFARHNLLRIAITTVIFSVCSLQYDYTTVNEYYEDLKLRCRYSKEKIPTLEQCEEHWHDYQNIYNDQAECWHQKDDERRIRNALRHMPNVKHLVLSSNAWEMASHPLHNLWCPPDYKIITPSRDPSGGPWKSSYGFSIMSSALLSNNIRLHSLSLHEIRLNSDGLHSISFTENTPKVLRHLRGVTLYLYIEIFQDLSWQTKFEKFLSNAREVESLEITSEPSENRSNLTTLFHTIWPKLFHLKLQVNIQFDSFIAFCQNHKESLHSLHLQSLCLFGGTWGDLMTAIRGQLRLTDAWLEDLYEGIADEKWIRLDSPADANIFRLSEAEEYLLYGGDNPFENNTLQLATYWL